MKMRSQTRNETENGSTFSRASYTRLTYGSAFLVDPDLREECLTAKRCSLFLKRSIYIVQIWINQSLSRPVKFTELNFRADAHDAVFWHDSRKKFICSNQTPRRRCGVIFTQSPVLSAVMLDLQTIAASK